VTQSNQIPEVQVEFTHKGKSLSLADVTSTENPVVETSPRLPSVFCCIKAGHLL
jgi:hypothetical protein